MSDTPPVIPSGSKPEVPSTELVTEAEAQAQAKAAIDAQVDKLDVDTNKLGKLERKALELLLEAAGKHQEIDEEYSSRINSLLRQIQEQFGTIVPLAEALRERLLVKDKKSAKRMTGMHAWRSHYGVEYVLPEEQIVANIKAKGRKYSRLFLRTVPSRVLDKNTLKLKDHKDLVAEIEGIEIVETETYTVTPSGVFPMTPSRDVTQFEGLPLPALMEELLRSTD